MQIQLREFGNDSVRIIKAQRAYDKLYFYLVRAKFALEELQFAKTNNLLTSPQYQKGINQFVKWFNTLDNVDVVYSNVTKILQRFEDEEVILINDELNGEPNDYAFVVNGNAELEIHLCAAFWNINEEEDRYDTCIGTILHELTHLVCCVRDITYDIDECQALASWESIDNANNYEYYIEEFKRF